MAVSVDLCVLIDPDEERWSPVTAVAAEAAVELWSRSPDPTCCALQAGFLLRIDGEPWNADALDEIGMAGTWLPALRGLLGGATRATVWPWEESGLVLSREGERVLAVDVHHSGHVVCPPVTLPLRELALAMADAAQLGAAWLEDVRRLAEAKRRRRLVEVLVDQGCGEWSGLARELRAAAAGSIPAPPPGDPGPLPALWVAVLVSDLDALDRSLPGSGPDLVVYGSSPLHLAVQHGWLAGVERLLAARSALRCRDGQGFTPLQQAARRALSRPDALRIVAALRAAGAEVDPISAVLIGDPAALMACTARGDISRETMNWWTFAMLHGGEEPQAWRPALQAAVAAGTPVLGGKRGLGGWTETTIEAARRAGRDDLVALIGSLSGAVPPSTGRER